MQASQIPTKIDEAWATNATSDYIRTIPDTSSDPNAASFSLGFPPNTFEAEAAGGKPPDGRDFNGILQQITQWTRWLNAGAPVEYDAAFSTLIGGYPAGAWVQSAASTTLWWVSQIDNNTSNPDSGGANWLSVSFGKAGSGNPNGTIAGVAPANGNVAGSLYWDLSGGTGLWICTTTGTISTAVWAQVNGAGDGPFYCGATTGSANAQSATTPTAMVNLVAGMIVSMRAGYSNTGALTIALTPAIGSSFGSYPVRKDSLTGPIALTGGEVVTGNAQAYLYDGAYLHLLNPALGTAAQANASSATGLVAAISGVIAAGQIPAFTDNIGTIGASGQTFATLNTTPIDATYAGQTLQPGTYAVDTTGGAFSVNLSATVLGAYVFFDARNYWSTNNFTINGNGHNIGNLSTNTASTFVANVSNRQFSITAAQTYWRLV